MQGPAGQGRALWVASVLLVAALLASAASAAPPISNGGARQWMAFDPSGRYLGNVQFLTKIITIANTSNAPNAFKIFYEPQHLAFCAATLPPGGTTLCGMQPSQRLSGGYFQVIAEQPVLMGGYSDTPVMNFVQNRQSGVFGADPANGTVQHVPFIWQAGCPPRPGSGCPSGVAPPLDGPGVDRPPLRPSDPR